MSDGIKAAAMAEEDHWEEVERAKGKFVSPFSRESETIRLLNIIGMTIETKSFVVSHLKSLGYFNQELHPANLAKSNFILVHPDGGILFQSFIPDGAYLGAVFMSLDDLFKLTRYVELRIPVHAWEAMDTWDFEEYVISQP